MEMLKKIISGIFLSVTASCLHGVTDSGNIKYENRLKEFADNKGGLLVSIGETATPPRIDGKLDTDEWADCTAFTGMRDFYSKRMLNEKSGLLVKSSYDTKNFYCLVIVPKKRPALPIRKSDDMDTFRDNGILDIMLVPSSRENEAIRRIAISASGSIVDMLNGDRSWNSDAEIAIGEEKNANSKWLNLAILPEKYWFIEMAVPLASLKMNACANEEWKFNIFWIDGGNFTFAAVVKGADDVENFATMKLLPKTCQVLAIYDIGSPATGDFRISGQLLNSDKLALGVEMDLLGFKQGTYFRTNTGYDEIMGALEPFSASPTGVFKSVSKRLTNLQCDFFDLQLKVAGNTQFRLAGQLSIPTPLEIKISNLPSSKKAKIKIQSVETAQILLTVTASDGKVMLKKTTSPGEIEVDYQNWAFDNYTFSAIQGNRQDKKTLSVSPPPIWLNNQVGVSDEILKPFAPLALDGKSITMWNRTYTWGNSLFFNYQSSQYGPLETAPVLMVQKGEKFFPVKLTKFTVINQSPSEVNLQLSGNGGNLTVNCTAKIEYDGLVWFELDVTGENGKPTAIDGLTLSTTFKSQYANLYHGAPDRALNGTIEKGEKLYPWQVYFWVGTPEGGLGYVNESRQMFHSTPAASAFTLKKHGEEVIWQVNFAGRGNVDKLHLSFGLQVTPVKQLPPHYDSLVTENWGSGRKSNFPKLSKYMKFCTIWRNNCNYMKYICDPAGIEYDILKDAVDNAHKEKVMAIPYFAPISFTEKVQPEYIDYYEEWVQQPIRQWKSEESVQVRSCVNSSYLDYLLYQLNEVEKKTGADGLYFDGAWPVECSNAIHGCGYIDDTGVLQPTYAVRKIREFLKRAATLTAHNVENQPNRPNFENYGKDFPDYHIWIHISGSVAPPMHSFATSLFCGEWFKQPIRAGQGYDTLLTIDKFRPRYLSQPWGIVNYFLPMINPKLDAKVHTNAILAYLIPQGVGLYPRYLEMTLVYQILQIKGDFGAEQSRFYPPWQSVPNLEILANSEVQTGIWVRPDGAMLLAIGNCSGQDADVTLKSTNAKKCRILLGNATESPIATSHLLYVPKNSLTIVELN
jgi:hypothetical protein